MKSLNVFQKIQLFLKKLFRSKKRPVSTVEVDTEVLQVLERIANSLEKIADALAQEPRKTARTRKFTVKNGENSLNSNYSNLIVDFLASHQIQIKTIPPEQETDEILDQIALFMGNRYGTIKKVYEPIKKSMNFGKVISLNLRETPQEDISNICQLCSKLHEIAFLEDYRYLRSPQYILTAKASRSSQSLNFLSGQWLERFVKTQIKSLVEERQLSFSYLINPQIILPNGDDFELDILFEIEQEIYWFEAKTSDYQKYIDKYSRMSKLLDLDRSQCYMVLTDVTDHSAKALSNLFGMTVVRVDRLAREFASILPVYNDE
jgi:hypothetical protein